MRMTMQTQLQRIADFDHPFRVHPSGSVGNIPGYVYAPEVYHSEEDDIEIHSELWEALRGYTGQYGYHGAVMHPSEYLGGTLAEDILDTPGVYVVVVVNVHDEDDCEDCEQEPAGWAVLRLKD